MQTVIEERTLLNGRQVAAYSKFGGRQHGVRSARPACTAAAPPACLLKEALAITYWQAQARLGRLQGPRSSSKLGGREAGTKGRSIARSRSEASKGAVMRGAGAPLLLLLAAAMAGTCAAFKAEEFKVRADDMWHATDRYEPFGMLATARRDRPLSAGRPAAAPCRSARTPPSAPACGATPARHSTSCQRRSRWTAPR